MALTLAVLMTGRIIPPHVASFGATRISKINRLNKRKESRATPVILFFYFSTPLYTFSVLHAEADVGAVVETLVVGMEGLRCLERADI